MAELGPAAATTDDGIENIGLARNRSVARQQPIDALELKSVDEETAVVSANS
ncbi:MAG: hypothetical protein KAY22_13450 [Rhizorhabdus sp.]|uniref:hypothetical protein n=1 Tax=Rhizorhabdus sp. TaxID=1968843 RepID=UPI001B406C49|nr:hypothetical protein [Rhizorhabdus sp.]MBP8233305.1 hypothetical protein [Rhizorhabdus sp.]